jgi:hypothetical protein
MNRKFFAPLAALALLTCVLAAPGEARGQAAKVKAAEAAAAAVAAKFGLKAASVPTLTAKIGQYAGKYGDDVLQAVRKVGPRCFSLVDDAGRLGAKAVGVLAKHGEAGAAHVLTRPAAMAHFARFGTRAADVMVKHPRVGEKLLTVGGASAVGALGAVTVQSGRRLAMVMDGPLARSPHQVELLEVVGKYGERAASFVWEHKGSLAVGATCLTFLRDPELFLGGKRTLP